MLAHATSVSAWLRLAADTNKHLSTVEVRLQVVCLCQRFDRHSPTLNTPQPDCICLGQRPLHTCLFAQKQHTCQVGRLSGLLRHCFLLAAVHGSARRF